MRLSRPCYDKPHRCPGWAGGGMLWPRRIRCDGGHLVDMYNFGYRLRPHRCNTCDVVALPLAVEWLDWRHYRFLLTTKLPAALRR